MKFRDWNDNEYELPEGKSFSWRPSAYAMIRNNDKILLIKSGFHKKWEFPGGAVELGERSGEGLIREVFEETGYKIKLKDDVPFFIDESFFYVACIDRYYQTIRFVYEAEILEKGRDGIVNGDNEVLDIKQVKIEDLVKYEFNDLTSKALKRFFKQ